MVKEGTYEIHPVVAPDKTIDCFHAVDTSGANVQIYDRNHTDAQYIYKMDNPDGSCRLAFVLTGKSIDIENGSIKAGSNVQQWSDNGSNAQKWMLVPDGKSINYDGQSYETYLIKAFADQTLAITTSGSASESNASIQTVGKSDMQRWFFVEQNTVPDGVYFIRSAMDDQAVLDVSGGSHANGAKVQLWGHNFTNAQAWIVKNVKAEKGLQLIRNAESGKCLAVVGSQNKDFAKIWQWENDGSPGLRWYAEADGNMQINGASVPTYILHYYGSSGTTRVMDAMAAQKNPGTELVIYPMHRAKNQQWAFQPTSLLDTSLPVPSDLKCGKSKDQTSGTTIGANGESKMYISWLCAGTDYQMRYRTRVRKVGKQIGAWSVWKSIRDGSHANDGFGNLGMPNCISENTSRKRADYAAEFQTVDNQTVDYAEVQTEVRRWSNSFKGEGNVQAHGSSASATFRCVWMPTLEITAVDWSPKGLDIYYKSDYKRDGNTISISEVSISGKTLCSSKQWSAQPYSGMVRIPISELNFVPDEGAKVQVRASIWTDVWQSDDAEKQVKLSYSTNRGLAVNPSYQAKEDYTVDVKFKPSKDDHVYLLCEGKLYECDGADGAYTVVPPLGKEYYILTTQNNGTAWGTASRRMPKMKYNGFLWNWNGKCAAIEWNLGSEPDFSDDQNIENSEHVTTGRPRPVYRFGNSVTRSLNVGGIYSAAVKFGDKAAMDSLSIAKHTIFRTPEGGRYRTAVLSVKMSPKSRRESVGEWGSVSIEQREES